MYINKKRARHYERALFSVFKLLASFLKQGRSQIEKNGTCFTGNLYKNISLQIMRQC